MTRSSRLWVVFALCLAAMLAGVGAISVAALRLERSEAEARGLAAIEEDVRLALWRMDSAVAPLIARESGRPWFVYAPLYAPERVYTRGRSAGSPSFSRSRATCMSTVRVWTARAGTRQTRSSSSSRDTGRPPARAR